VDTLRIVHIVRGPENKGTEAFVSNLTREQAAAGHHVSIVTMSAHRSAERAAIANDGDMESKKTVARKTLWLKSGRELLHALDHADVVHVHGLDRTFDFLAMTKWRHKKPLVLTTHDSLPRSDAWLRTVTRSFLGSYGFIAASSVRDAERLHKLRSRGMRVVAGGTNIAGDYEGIYRRVIGRDTRYLLGAETSVTQADHLIEKIDAQIAQRIPVRLAFLNANLANLIARDVALGEDLRSFTLVNDGVGVDIASRLLYGSRFPENLNGTDFAPHFLDVTSHRLKLFLLGATREALDAAVEKFRIRWPQHLIVGVQDGFFDEKESAGVVRRIEAADPDLVLVGMGNPRQERWIAQYLSDYRGSAFAVGALFDFISGRVPRAPIWVRKLRAEWVYRLSLEPQRMWRRYLIGNFVFLSHVLAQMMRGERAH
jgi:exopolysaccharide biosynthesis WecB/TagA/CpsF family protein